jgi:nucleolysin TIA-1/TIAR
MTQAVTQSNKNFATVLNRSQASVNNQTSSWRGSPHPSAAGQLPSGWADLEALYNISEDTSDHFHIFVGSLSDEINEDALRQVFSDFGSISEVRVMRDTQTGRSRGYGFVSFRDRADAEKALSSKDGAWLGSQAICCNWANQTLWASQEPNAIGMNPITHTHNTIPPGTASSNSSELPKPATSERAWQDMPYNAESRTTPDLSRLGKLLGHRDTTEAR